MNTASIAGRYERALENGGNVVARVSAQYTGEYFYDDPNLIRQEAYTLIDANIAYTTPSGRWTATLWGKNLTDENYANWGSTLGGLGENRFPGNPRTFGIRLETEF